MKGIDYAKIRRLNKRLEVLYRDAQSLVVDEEEFISDYQELTESLEKLKEDTEKFNLKVSKKFEEFRKEQLKGIDKK